MNEGSCWSCGWSFEKFNTSGANKIGSGVSELQPFCQNCVGWNIMLLAQFFLAKPFVVPSYVLYAFLCIKTFSSTHQPWFDEQNGSAKALCAVFSPRTCIPRTWLLQHSPMQQPNTASTIWQPSRRHPRNIRVDASPRMQSTFWCPRSRMQKDGPWCFYLHPSRVSRTQGLCASTCWASHGHRAVSRCHQAPLRSFTWNRRFSWRFLPNWWTRASNWQPSWACCQEYPNQNYLPQRPVTSTMTVLGMGWELPTYPHCTQYTSNKLLVRLNIL